MFEGRPRKRVASHANPIQQAEHESHLTLVNSQVMVLPTDWLEHVQLTCEFGWDLDLPRKQFCLEYAIPQEAVRVGHRSPQRRARMPNTGQSSSYPTALGWPSFSGRQQKDSTNWTPDLQIRTTRPFENSQSQTGFRVLHYSCVIQVSSASASTSASSVHS